ncbi:MULTISPECIES: prepilin-type N-terminal cleavage/methylation domain-containing protein [unclassified Pseudomonas]|uniref:PilW family protein n=1 Tax=unclassified Pseudomonas TaxID=196821 RepID=UPI00195E0D2F|nr:MULTISPECIES: prepilin-type N-terminal cleavage/methylation domain-containing protein [unclassified Pseudomonas]MBM7397895.1 type IV pilus assembly protein PilW [Pseudomonas sp. M5]GLH35101.1 pilus assembly protein PilW [Pseudomonas sp. BR1R-5]HDS1758223.1 prepilin-type N-terminal cleavage/methylation domain-containing protein [Pseudomonas putida]
MKREQGGFGLVEAMLALAIGLMLLTAASQLFISAHQSSLLQSAALRMQADARLALLRMAQDIRMAGMFGCLRLEPGDFRDPSAREAFARPLQIGPASLSLIVAELPGYPGAPDWTLHTDCISEAEVHAGRAQSPGLPLAFPISRHHYQLRGSTLRFMRRNSSQPLVDHVREMRVEPVDTAEGQRVDVQLTLFDPGLGIEQRHDMSVAIRNPVARP